MNITHKDKVSPGQPFRPNVRVHNATVEELLRQGKATAREIFGYAPGSHIPISIKASTVVAPGAVVGFGNPIGLVAANDEGMEAPAFSSDTPAEGRWAVAQQGIFQDEAGECVLIGLAWAEVNVTDATHTHADIDSGSLASMESGYAKIIYKPAGTGTSWCLLQLGCCGGSGGSSGGVVISPPECPCCDTFDWMEKEAEHAGTLNDEYEPGTTMLERLNQLRGLANCPMGTKTCFSCAEGTIISPTRLTFAGVELKTALGTLLGLDANNLQIVSDLINKAHVGFDGTPFGEACDDTFLFSTALGDFTSALAGVTALNVSISQAGAGAANGWWLEIRLENDFHSHLVIIQIKGGNLATNNCHNKVEFAASGGTTTYTGHEFGGDGVGGTTYTAEYVRDDLLSVESAVGEIRPGGT